MIVGVPRETLPGERRVALIPEVVAALGRAGVSVAVERGAGANAGFDDAQFTERGATLFGDRTELYAAADVLVQVRTWGSNRAEGLAELERHRPAQVVVGLADPLGATDRVAEMARRGLTVFGLELLPRITRAQSMDVLSSMATIAGYKAALMAAERLPRCFPMFMTAAGTVKPARVLVVGAGVAGLQAIATAKRLGAVVSAYDVRPEVADQVRSVGGTFVELALEAGDDAADDGGYARARDESFYRRQRELLTRVVGASDVVITTAAVPGRRAPVLVTSDMIREMAPGSVIIDLAAETGGNCELSRPGQEVSEAGVTVIAPLNLAAGVPFHASQLYARNVTNFLLHVVEDGALALEGDDEIVGGTLLCRDGEVVHPRLRGGVADREVA